MLLSVALIETTTSAIFFRVFLERFSTGAIRRGVTKEVKIIFSCSSQSVPFLYEFEHSSSYAVREQGDASCDAFIGMNRFLEGA